MSYSDDTLQYMHWGIELYPVEKSQPSPARKSLVMTDFSQFPLSEDGHAKGVAYIESLGYREVEIRTKYQTFGLSYRLEYWGVKI